MDSTDRRSKVLIGAVVAAVVVALLAVLLLRGGDDGKATANGPSTTTATPVSVGGDDGLRRDGAAVAGRILAPPEAAPIVASAQGTVQSPDLPHDQPAVAEILGVEAGPSDILLRWRLRTTGASIDLSPLFLRSATEATHSTSGVVLVDPAGHERATPFRFAAPGFDAAGCVCSSAPAQIDQTGQVLTGLYPLFSHPPSTVDVEIPGFPPITGVPVSRR
ncbi:MAG TPA: hypothetical protein VFJ85_14515 [Acidimicrobiales bacterium]|nr:hypothetical protein [Acidimicrobiales bacterium]